VALLLIILAVFALWGFGSGSAGTTTTFRGSQSHPKVQRQLVTDCVEVTWKGPNGPSHVRPCHKAPAK
jgi:hypothetical protein